MGELDPLALELWLDRCEAALAPELAAHDRAVLAAALVDRAPPPPPPGLLDPALLALPARAARQGEPALVHRAAVLARWSLSARLAIDAEVRAAAASARDLAGVTRRQRALAQAARRLGLADPLAAIAALYGAAPVAPAEPIVPGDVPTIGALGASAPTLLASLPEPHDVLATLAAATAIDPAAIRLHRAPRALTLVISGGDEIHCLIRAGDDALASLVIAVHELGHGLLAAARRGPSATLAAPTSRVHDEAAAAWAVRALEEPAVVADPRTRAELARRRRRRERLTAALAGFEAACLGGVPADVAWSAVAAVDPRPPATFAALFDEPGVMAAYHAADRAAARADFTIAGAR